MNQVSHKVHTKARKGAAQPYIIGFLFSLLLTVNSYYVVVSKSAEGNTLLAIILTFAFLQMLVQIFFFLHLGRGPKPLYNVVFFVSTVGIILIVVLGSIFIMNNLYSNMSASQVTTKLAEKESIHQVGGKETGACQQIKTHRVVTILSGKVSPFHTDAHLCDTLTIVNRDDTVRDILFGVRPERQVYGGESEVFIHKGYPKTVTLNVLGSYKFYDNFDGGITGSFTVRPE